MTAGDARMLIIAAVRKAMAIVRQTHVRHRQRRLARAICYELRVLDDRTLRDLGLVRDEIGSIAAELTGEAECTRIRVLRMAHRVQS